VSGNGKVERAISVGLDEEWKPIEGTEREWAVDVVCLALGLSPLSELAWMAGCKFEYVPQLGGHVAVHDEDMETTVPGIYVAGDLAGIEEASTAMEEGKLAGIAAAEALGRLTMEEARERKEGARRRLGELRSGPFGEGRRVAKERLVWGR
jgi:thioredoxin reductase